MRREGRARIWFTPKQKAELWEGWKSGQCVADIAGCRFVTLTGVTLISSPRYLNTEILSLLVKSLERPA